MHFHVVTIFPGSLKSYIETSMLRKATENKKVHISFCDPRNFATDKHHKVDDTPYGGGAGMVMKAEPILKTVETILKKTPGSLASKWRRNRVKIVILSAKGKQFTQKLARTWQKKYNRIILITGRYEGIDERVKTILRAEEISVGPYVLTDGELPAGLIISAVTRLIPGVLRFESLNEESHGYHKKEKTGSLEISSQNLEYPHYTRPETIVHEGKKYRVPKILLGGNHTEIKEWRKSRSK